MHIETILKNNIRFKEQCVFFCQKTFCQRQGIDVVCCRIDRVFHISKPLHDFIYESNQGHDVFFVSAKEEAVERLTR